MSIHKYFYKGTYVRYATKKVTFRNCNYEATTELCSNTTIRRTQNYNSYYRKLQCVLRKTTGASTQHYGTSNVEQIMICTVQPA